MKLQKAQSAEASATPTPTPTPALTPKPVAAANGPTEAAAMPKLTDNNKGGMSSATPNLPAHTSKVDEGRKSSLGDEVMEFEEFDD